MNQIIIHIGMPKTGSTSLQATLSSLSSDKFYYPSTKPNPGRRLFINEWALHRFLSRELVSENIDQLLEKIRSYLKLAEGRTLILSDESIFTYWHVFGQETFARLITELNRDVDKVTIIYVKREWRDFSVAFYKEYQKHYVANSSRFLARRTLLFEDWINDPLTLKMYSSFFTIESQLAESNLIELKSCVYSQEVNSWILHDLGIFDYKLEVVKENISFSNEDSELMRIFNKWPYSQSAKEAFIALLIPNNFDLSRYDRDLLKKRITEGYDELLNFLRMAQYFLPQESESFVINPDCFHLRVNELTNKLMRELNLIHE